MDRSHVGEDADIRARNPAHLGDFAGGAHPHLKDCDVVIRRKAEDREWKPEQVVVVSRRPVRAVLGLQNVGREFFGRRLADAAGNGHQTSAPAPPDVRGKIFQRLVRVLHPKQNPAFGIRFCKRVAEIHNGPTGSSGQDRTDELMAVVPGAPNGEKQISGLNRARIYGNPADGGVSRS